MKKLLIMIALVAGIATLSKAQGGGQMGTPEERAQRTLDRPNMAAFNFTADQKTKITAILVKQNKSNDSLMAATPGDDIRAKMTAAAPKRTAISAANEAAIVALLTPDQKKAYDTALAAAKERNPNATAVFTGGGGRPRQQ